MSNKYKVGFSRLMNESLEQVQYAFSDIIKNIARLRGQAKSDQDEEAVISMDDLERRACSIQDKVGQMRLSYQDYLTPQLQAISNCLDAELRRLTVLKSHIINHNKYECAARLRELEKDIQDMQRHIRDLHH